jgi:SAM-dependent methyltransferase
VKIESRLGLNKTRYRDIVYATDDVLSTKKRVHELYSSVPLDLNNEIYESSGLKGMETLLDIGCGTGDFLMYLRKNKNYTGTLYGADLATGVFNKSRIISNQEKLNIQFMEASILELPFKPKSIDVVTGLHMLSHVPIYRACDEVKRVLKDDGKFIVTANSLQSYPNIAKYRKMSFKMMGWGEPVFTTTFFNLENMEERLSGSWATVIIKKLHGELRIPLKDFLKYFYANMLVWEPMPTKEESDAILKMVSRRLIVDVPDGYVIEPKYAGIAICNK